MSLIFSVVVFTLIALITRWYLKRRRIIRLLESLPGPPPLPIVGNALDLASPSACLPKFLEYKEKYGSIVKIWIGFNPSVILVMDYKFTEYLLNSTEIMNKSKEYRFLHTWLGTGLLISDGDAKWKRHRKVLAQAFYFKVLEGFPEIFDAVSKILIQKLRAEVGKESTDISTYVTHCTLDIICESVMGSSLNVQENPDTDYVRSVKTMCRIVVERSFNPFLQNQFTYLFSKQCFLEKEAVRILHNYVNGVIKRKQKEFENNFNINCTIDDIGQKRKFAFLDLLLFEKLQNGSFTDDDIREEVDTFMFAGHDTMSSAISFCIFCLAEHQDVQKKVVQELCEIFQGNRSSYAGYRDLQQMKYLDAVIKETLRLYPSVPFFARNVHKDIQYNGVTLPKGLSLTIVAYAIHRNAEYFPNPDKFDPDRFLTDNVLTQHPFCYLPFSLGQRNCIGQKFAMLAMKSVLSTVLRNFQILPTSPKHKLELAAETVLTSQNGIRIRLINKTF